MSLDEPAQAALNEAIAAGTKRDVQLAKSERARRHLLVLMVILTAITVATCVVCVVAVIGYGHGASARSTKFETVLVCSANSQRDVAQDIVIAGQGGHNYTIPVKCEVPK